MRVRLPLSVVNCTLLDGAFLSAAPADGGDQDELETVDSEIDTGSQAGITDSETS